VKSISIVLATLLISFNVPNSHGQQADEHPQLVPFRWSGELNIPDPVAISLDDDGAAYVTQTQRRKSQDLDIRNNLDWIPFDVGLRSVEEKRIFFRQQLSPERGQTAESKRRVQDMNRDGSHDYLDLRVLSERIYRIQDKDRDGTADSSELFADDFQTEVTGIGAGVLAFDDFVYATIAPDVWRLQDTNGDGRADSRQVLATGFGLHIAYAGHDMHGLTVGPDGRA
jgi:quinoprotein glucose dehydrogenase